MFGPGVGTRIVVTDTVDPKVIGQFDNIAAVVEETRIVRVWDGIHFRNTQEVSDVMGREVAAYLVANSIRPVRSQRVLSQLSCP